MERVVALKVIHPRLMRHPSAVERFHQEVRAAARLDHANIVTAYDADQAGELHFLVMEYVQGTSLAEVLAERGTLPVADACRYAREAALGLQHAHEQGLVHRDIKPHNLMLTPEGRVKILDFGLARLASGDESPVPGDAPTGPLTAAGMVMGTADYIAPEQVADPRTADTRCDIYSLGCTLFHLLAGRPPFPVGTAREKLALHADASFPSVCESRPGIPPGLERVLARMTAKAPADRYASPAAEAALAPFCGPEPRRSRFSPVRLLLAAGLLLAVGLLPFALSHFGNAPKPGEAPGREAVEPIARPDDAALRAEQAEKAEAEALRVIEKCGGRVGPGSPVTLVILGGSTVTDADLAALPALEGIRILDLANTSIGDGGLKHLTGLKRLSRLVLAGTKITDKGMKSVAESTQLEELEVQMTRIGTPG